MACTNDVLSDATVAITLPDIDNLKTFDGSDSIWDEEGNPILDETSCAIEEE